MGNPARDFREIEISSITVGVQQLRAECEDDSIGELAEDIASHGLLQPIGVSVVGPGAFQLLWGSRRLAAHQRLGRRVILARVMVAGEGDVKGLALVENLQRQQLTLAEEIAGVTYMVETQGKSVESVASVLSKSRSWVLNRLMVPNLPEFLSGPLLSGDLKLGHVEVICQIPDEGGQRYVASQVIQGRWTVGQAKQLAEIYKSSPGLGGVVPIPHAAQSMAAPVAPMVWVCEVCGDRGILSQFRLVRVCVDGCRSERGEDRAIETNGGSGGLETESDQHGGGKSDSDV